MTTLHPTEPTRHPPEVIEAARLLTASDKTKFDAAAVTLTGKPKPSIYVDGYEDYDEWFRWIQSAYEKAAEVLRDALACAEAENAELRAALASPGVAAIARERLAHTTREGWTPEHDDRHVFGEMAKAAATYAHPQNASHVFVARWWPWSLDWWKPTPENRKRELEKAGALLAAEWDRLDRIEKAAREAAKGTK